MAMLMLGGCGQGESSVDPSPGRPEDSSTTTSTVEDLDGDGDEVQTAEPAPTTEVVTDSGVATSTTVVINQSSANAVEYTELAASGLVLTLEEQDCADSAVDEALDGGIGRLEAIITAVQTCASPKAVDDFAAVLLSAGGERLPATEAACVAGQLRLGDDYRPFWSALFAEQPFDFLAADSDVQNQYLDLFARCVSVGRALSEQTETDLSPATIGCVDDLYADREFVRSTIEADLSANIEDVRRVNDQIGACLTQAERFALGL